jgi:hypothetical protein
MIYKERNADGLILITNEANSQTFVQFFKLGEDAQTLPTVFRMRVDDFHRRFKPFGVERSVDIISGKEVEVCDGHFFT